MSCDKEQAKKDEYEEYQKHLDSVNNEADSIPKYIYNIVVNGDTDDYYSLRIIYSDYNVNSFLPFEVIMAEKHGFPTAYSDAISTILTSSGKDIYEINQLDSASRKLVLKYLKASYELGDESAIGVVDSLKIKF
jgi:hypothetical protein